MAPLNDSLLVDALVPLLVTVAIVTIIRATNATPLNPAQPPTAFAAEVCPTSGPVGPFSITEFFFIKNPKRARYYPTPVGALIQAPKSADSGLVQTGPGTVRFRVGTPHFSAHGLEEVDHHLPSLPSFSNYVDIDPEKKDIFGIPPLRFHFHWGENELLMWEHSKTFVCRSKSF